MMEDNTRQALRQLQPALKALAKSVERSYWSGTYEGTGDMAVKSYRSLQKRIAQILPDDYYITDALVLEIAPEATEQQKVAQVQLAVSQLLNYLEGLLRSNRPGSEVEDLSELGRELRDRIVMTTREALRKAMENMDIDIDIDAEPWGVKKKRIVIKGQGDRDDDEDSSKRVEVEVEMDEDDDEDRPKGKPPIA
jgi:hypothetical protein